MFTEGEEGSGPVWGSLQCHEAFALLLYSGLAITMLVFLPRWVRTKLDTMFLQAVSRKAKENQEKSESFAHSSCHPGGDGAIDSCWLCQEEDIVEKELQDVYMNEGEDPDYMSIRDDGCGEYIVSRVMAP